MWLVTFPNTTTMGLPTRTMDLVATNERKQNDIGTVGNVNSRCQSEKGSGMGVGLMTVMDTGLPLGSEPSALARSKVYGPTGALLLT